MAQEATQNEQRQDWFEKAIRQIADMPYYTLPLDEAAIDSLFKRYNKAVAIADEAVAKAEGRS